MIKTNSGKSPSWSYPEISILCKFVFFQAKEVQRAIKVSFELFACEIIFNPDTAKSLNGSCRSQEVNFLFFFNFVLIIIIFNFLLLVLFNLEINWGDASNLSLNDLPKKDWSLHFYPLIDWRNFQLVFFSFFTRYLSFLDVDKFPNDVFQ